MELFSWNPSDFAMDWYSCSYWWGVLKSVLKLSNIFCADGFLIQSLHTTLKMNVFIKTLYNADMVFSG